MSVTRIPVKDINNPNSYKFKAGVPRDFSFDVPVAFKGFQVKVSNAEGQHKINGCTVTVVSGASMTEEEGGTTGSGTKTPIIAAEGTVNFSVRLDKDGTVRVGAFCHKSVPKSIQR